MPGIITVRNVVIGEGIPKIIVPIVANTPEEIYSEALNIKVLPTDVAEWRADYYEDAPNSISVIKVLRKLREILGDIPLLFTFRSAKEGGEKTISMEEYEALNISVAKSGYADLIDVEIFSGDEVAGRIIKAIHGANRLAVGSNHDFHKTPEKEDIIARLIKMQEMDADILKIAFMPENIRDVLTLLGAAVEMNEKHARKPLVAISMSDTGVLSRIACEAFGSAMTFGSAGKSSAPGQIPVEELSPILQTMHRSMNGN